MILSNRLEQAINKLYEAFHSGSLHPECSCNCAVGNILDRKDFWKNLSDDHGSLQLNYVGIVNQKFGKRFNGYSPLELLHIENAFLRGCGYSIPLRHNGSKPHYPQSMDVQFEGLCEAITVLCKLDGIKNVLDVNQLMDYTPATSNVPASVVAL